MRYKCCSRTSRVDRLKLNRSQIYGIHSTIRSILFCSRIMGLLPLTGLNNKFSDKLRFTLRSPYTIYYTFTLFGQVSMFISSSGYLFYNGITLPSFSISMFTASSLVFLLILLNIGRHWPSFVYAVETIEKSLPPFNKNVGTIANTTMAFILIAAAVEHVLSIMYGIKMARSYDSLNIAANYYKLSMPWIFEITPFALWKGLIAEFFNLQAAFIWSFNDLLTMIISIHLTEHFLVHNDLLKSAVVKDHFTCTEFRKQYLKIVYLVKLINRQFGIYILTSFGGNLFWICKQLFYTLTNVHNRVEHSIYFTYSLSFLVARTVMVLLLAARIHSCGQAPLNVLYNLPSIKFNLEVERYIAQIKHIQIAISGLEFFHVTRTMILSLIGTIVTYELVLLQINR